jgi:glyoxylase-like metal-dependent hydrolase (beta-lactamase superfamily II)
MNNKVIILLIVFVIFVVSGSVLGSEKKTNDNPSLTVIKKLTEHIYYMQHDSRTDRPVLAIVSGEKESLIIDAGASPTHARQFLSGIKELALPKPEYLVLTHWHWDHVFGAATMNLITIAHEITKKKLEEMATLKWDDASLDRRVKEGTEIEFCASMMKLEMPNRDNLVIGIPDRSYTGKMKMNLGNLECLIEHVGGDHSPDCTVVFVPRDRVLFIGDCRYPAYYSGESSFSMGKVIPLYEKLLSYDAEYYVDSHEKYTTKAEMRKWYDELKSVGNLVGQATDIETVVEKHKKLFGKKPGGRKLYLIKHFIAGNKK